MLENLLPGVAHLQNIHPLFVHYPIAFLTGATFFYFLAWLTGKETFTTTAFALLIIGALAAAVAVGTGLYAEDGVMISRSVRTHLFARHKNLMLGTMALAIVLASWSIVARPFPAKGRALFLFLLLALLAVMTLGADYGARMVYDYNAGGNACSQPIEFAE